jgi:hypothetical protein
MKKIAFKTQAVLLFSFCSLHIHFSFGQGEIPIGTWRANLSYNKIFSVAIGDGVTYGASEMGIVTFDISEQSFTTLNKINGLSSSGITSINFNTTGGELLVTYEDGNLDIISGNVVTNFSRLKELNTIVGSKRINHVSTRNNFAFLSTDYGIVVFDIAKNELKETWRDLGTEGNDIRILQTAFQNDSIFAATSAGVIAGKMSDNLLDFNNWKRFNTGDFAGTVHLITSFNGMIYAAVDGNGLYRLRSDGFVKETAFSSANFSSIQPSAQALLIVANNKLWKLTSDQSVTQIADENIINALTAVADSDDNLWIGDSVNGLVSNASGTFEHYLPNGPSLEKAFGLRYISGKLYAFAGGFNASGEASGNPGIIDYLYNGIWHNKLSTLTDITDMSVSANKLYTASFGKGLLQEDDAGNSILFDNTNSPLIASLVPEASVNISALEAGSSGLWVGNFNTMPSLHLLKPDNTWQSFTTSYAQGMYPIELEEDYVGNLWMATNPGFGGGLIVFHADGTTILKTNIEGSGGLLNKSIKCIAVDREGNVWVGSNGGVAYFFSDTEDAVIPIFENRFLLKDEEITDIEVDGANRKWMGTKHGAWLFDATGESLVYNFTEKNSPLLSNIILDIEINHESGEVFFATEKGIVSFRAEATTGVENPSDIKIFPNPVTANFNGTVGITGLATDSFVKITDSSGKLIWEVRAQGGTATWNVRDYNGRRASSGIYLVFSASSDGSDSVVGKIAVIE